MTQRYAHLNLGHMKRIAKLRFPRREAEVLEIAQRRNG
jgi:hypothetical protein